MQQGCLNKSLLFLLVLCLVFTLVACDVSTIIDKLEDIRSNNAGSSEDAPLSENVFISDSMENDFSVEVEEGMSTLTNPDGSFSVIIDGNGSVVNGSSLIVSGSVSDEAYYIVDGNLVTADGTVIGSVEVLENEGSFVWYGEEITGE